MKGIVLSIFLMVLLSNQISFGQVFNIDSCGRDSNPILNHYEIIFFDSLMFAPYRTKKIIIDPRDSFDFKNKKLAFFSCAINADHKGEGLLSKKEFFDMTKPDLHGHAGIGLIKFNEEEKKESHEYDGAIIIDCLVYTDRLKEVILSMLANMDKP